MKRQKRNKRKSYAWIIAAVVVLAAAAVLFFSLFTFAGGVMLRRSSLNDLRGMELSAEQYDAICAELGSEPLWDVPIGGERYDSSSVSIRTGGFEIEELELFSYLKELESVDARGADCYEAIFALAEANSHITVSYDVGVSSQRISGEEESAVIDAAVSFEELYGALSYLPRLRSLDIRNAGLSYEEEQHLIESFPGIRFICTTEIAGQLLDGTSKSLSIENARSSDVEALIANSARLYYLESIDLGQLFLSNEQFSALRKAYPEAEILCRLSFYGVEVSSDTNTLVLDGIQISDTGELDLAVELLQELETIYMSDCGLSNEELDALNKKYGDVRIIWTVYVKWFDCRTDAIDFCVSRITNNYGMMTMTDETIYPIRYCTDMVTLDLGHMVYYNSDFVENMPKLRFLIMGDTNVSSIEALRNCPELYFLEIFLTEVSDLSPLFELKELRYLNISYCPIEDYTQLFQLTQLEKLWFVKSGLTYEQQEEIRQALPNTECCFETGDDSSVDVGWRTTPGYYEMRDNLGMFYHFG